MEIDKLINYVFNFEGKKIGIYGTGTGSIKVINALGVLYKDVICFFETSPSKVEFLGKTILSASKENLENVDLIIVASHYTNEIKNYLLTMELPNVYYPFVDITENPRNQIVYTEDRIENGVPIGRRTYSTENTIDYYNHIDSIGAFSSINPRAAIGGTNHPMKFVSSHPAFYKLVKQSRGFDTYPYINEKIDISELNPKIKIGNDVWIGTNAVILPGVEIGDGAVIGAGAVVTKSVPPYSIVVGVPAKVIKYRFSQEVIKGLLKIKWWNWSDEKIKDNIKYFYDPEKFVERFLEK